MSLGLPGTLHVEYINDIPYCTLCKQRTDILIVYRLSKDAIQSFPGCSQCLKDDIQLSDMKGADMPRVLTARDW